MNKKDLLTKLFDDKITRILSVLVNQPKEFYLTELATESKVPTASTYRILNKLAKSKIIQIKKISKFKLYSLANNQEAQFVSFLFLEKQSSLDSFVALVREDQKIDAIIRHGEESSDKANLIIIGKGVHTERLDQLTQDIARETGFEISYVTIDSAQYKKMTSMGLYAGKKTTLYSK
jgi:Fe2+ or Zn2+ uptake regulation protein